MEKGIGIDIGINGFVEAYLTDLDGTKKKVFESKNTFYVDFEIALAKHLYNNYDIALDNQFSTSAPLNDEDGIVAGEGVNWIAFVGTTSEPAADKFRISGVYTNGTGSSVSVIAPGMGKRWRDNFYTYVPPFADFRVAFDPLWSTQVVPNGQTLTIVWTITFTNH